MYRAFNLKMDSDSLASSAVDQEKHESEKARSREILEQLIASQETVSASEIKNILLPKKSYDIFLSHSRNDIDLALCVKKYLETVFGLTVFIDSVYWGNIDCLQEILNEYHHDREKNLFLHKKTMQVAAHANIILASALTEMINCCESIFFLNTDNSVIKGKDVVDGNDATYSPWIYHEIYTTTIIKPKPPKRHEAAFESRDSASVLYESFPQIEYNLNLDKMELLNKNRLIIWQNECLKDKTVSPLDVLYKMRW